MGSSFRLFAELKSNHEQGASPAPFRPTSIASMSTRRSSISVVSRRRRCCVPGVRKLLYGSGRRIFPRNGPNVRGNFDAVRLLTRPGDRRADAFVFHPVAIDPGRFDDDTIDTQTFWGVYATGPPQRRLRLRCSTSTTLARTAKAPASSRALRTSTAADRRARACTGASMPGITTMR